MSDKMSLKKCSESYICENDDVYSVGKAISGKYWGAWLQYRTLGPTSFRDGPVVKGGTKREVLQKLLVHINQKKANSPVEDLPIQDPNFQTPKTDPQDVIYICNMATTIYKNTEYANQVQPMVVNLLAQVDKETLAQAIKNVSEMFDNNRRPHDKRPGFAKQFCSAKAVKEMAERPAQPVVAPESKSKEADKAWLDKKED